MKLEPIKLIITFVDDKLEEDIHEQFYFKVKGRVYYKQPIKKKNGEVVSILAFNSFSKINLFPRSQEQFDETRKRLLEQKNEDGTLVASPKLTLLIDEPEIFTTIKCYNGKFKTDITLNGSQYDFLTKKMFPKRAGRTKKGE